MDRWQHTRREKVPSSCKVLAAQQQYRMIRFAVVLQQDSLNISGVWGQREWCILRVRHPRIDEASSSVIGLDQTRRVVQSAGFAEEQGKMGSLDSMDAIGFFGPNTRNPSQDESGNVGGNRPPGFVHNEGSCLLGGNDVRLLSHFVQCEIKLLIIYIAWEQFIEHHWFMIGQIPVGCSGCNLKIVEMGGRF
uniref:Uncharacterized protein n=1 Tax=Romanomermis culicivorax TaxID=13658 RepID=A0A915L7S0_ROMCU